MKQWLYILTLLLIAPHLSAVERTPSDDPTCPSLFNRSTDFSLLNYMENSSPLSQENYKKWYALKWPTFAPAEIYAYALRKISHGNRVHAETVVSMYLQNKQVSRVISLDEFFKLAEITASSPFSSPWDLRPVLDNIFSLNGPKDPDPKKVIRLAAKVSGLERNKILIPFLGENFYKLENLTDRYLYIRVLEMYEEDTYGNPSRFIRALREQYRLTPSERSRLEELLIRLYEAEKKNYL